MIQESTSNIAPHCEVTVTPSTLVSGGDLIIDASQSTDPDGSISSVLITVTDADHSVVQKKIDQPPFIHQMTMTEPGDYTIQVSVTDNNGLESSSPKCEAIACDTLVPYSCKSLIKNKKPRNELRSWLVMEILFNIERDLFSCGRERG